MKEIDVSKSIVAFRQWIEENKPIFSTPTNDEFLLRFLNANDFELNDAKHHLVRFWKFRFENPQWFTNRDLVENSLMRQIGESAYCFQLPEKTASGCSIFVMRIGHYNSNIMKFDDVTRYAFAVSDIINEEESVHVDGLIIILDMSEVNLQHVPQFSADFSRRYIDCWEKMYPVRLVQVHFYNYPNLFDPVNGLFRTLYYQGFDERIFIHVNDQEKSAKNPLHDYIDPAILPKEYGGKLGSIDEINQTFLQWTRAQNQVCKNFENYSIDLTKAQQLLEQLQLQQQQKQQ